MKLTIQILTLGVLMGVAAGASAQTMVRFPAASTPTTLQKPTIGQIAAPAPIVPAQPATASCPTHYDAAVIAREARAFWAEQYQQMLKVRMAAFKQCVSDCVGNVDPSSFGAEDPNDPKDFDYSSVVGLCHETCS